jgi:hypothetical protein
MKKLPRSVPQPYRHNVRKHGHAKPSDTAGTQLHIANVRRPKSKQHITANNRQHGLLRGWKAITEFLALPVATAQRWGKSGMPVHREGRFTVADIDELRRWLGRESEMPAPAHIATNNADLTTGLRESISAMRRHKRAS